MRLDVYLQQRYPGISRANLQKLIKAGKASINGKTSQKTGMKIRSSDKVAIDYDPDQEIVLPTIELPIIYEDNDCVVIDKPLGLLTHSKGEFNPEATVASWLSGRPHFNFTETDDNNQRQGIVHRLDRATSGVMICAKNPLALRHLQKQFQDRKAKKTYIARISGQIEPPAALIDLPIERNPKQPQRFRVGQNGKNSQTGYATIQVITHRKGFDSVLELTPLTGRTHQLRVHLNYMKHPIVGDGFYEGRPAKRLFLHAKSLEITTPDKLRQTFTSDESPEFYESDI